MNLILVGLIITLAHKSYEMIYETADNVMRWIGFGTRPLGEAQGEASTNRVYAGAAMYSRDATGSMVAKGGGQPDASGKNKGSSADGGDGGGSGGAKATNANVAGGTDGTSGKQAGGDGGGQSQGGQGSQNLAGGSTGNSGDQGGAPQGGGNALR